jgi:hypothetical protein
MIHVDDTKFELERLGVAIGHVNPRKQIWELSSILIQSEVSYYETGTVVFVACNRMGFPINNAEFIIGFGDIVTYPDQDYPGRYSMKLDRVYDPSIERGPYWGGFLEEGIAPEVVGFGIPKGHTFEIKFVYTKLEGGA